ncbi:MAG: response regulator [Gaiellales bacterium]
MTVSVLTADDERLIRAGLRATLETTPDIRVVAEAENGAEAVDRTRELRPDVVLMDMRMPVMDGIAATAAIADEGLGSVLVLTTFESDDLVLDALGAGASGYLLKRCPPEELIDAIRVVAAGEAVLASSVAAAVVRRLRRVPRFAQAASARIGELTPREHEILLLVAQSLTNAEIAACCSLSEGTVKTHVKHLFAKLGLRDRAQAVVFAYETGLVVPGEGRETPAPG